MLEKFDNVLQTNDDKLFYNEDFGKVTFIANQRHNLAVDLNKINRDNDNNIHEDDPDTSTHVRPFSWRYKYKKRKANKKR